MRKFKIEFDDSNKNLNPDKKKDYPFHYALSQEDFYNDVKRISDGNANKYGINLDILALSMSSYFDKEEANKTKNNSKYYRGHNLGLKMKFYLINENKAKFSFFEKVQIGNMCRVTELIEKKAELLTDIGNIDDVTLENKIALVVFEFSPIDIYTKKVLCTEYYSFSFVFFNVKNQSIEIALNMPFHDCDLKDDNLRETVYKDKFLSAPMIIKSNEYVEDFLKAMFFY